ncbi:peptidoglycan-binding protein [Streptomyces sp. TLI_105]|uniref:peptidoglycan-binding domain-containing protein n=1 Tax=Streptomyces sp. TLI_105 TaxID=1881019 RepID=UPI000B89561D|nr:peptidoglycan-binding domain-containing protein [Streptomyces sp. TLI_105]
MPGQKTTGRPAFSGARHHHFGPVADGRVREFQQRVDIAVDGIVGPQTWGRLTQ